MNRLPDTTQPGSGVHLLLLHPTGSEDPQQMSLAVGMLEWIRHGFEGRSVRCSFWPETAVDLQGHRRFIMRSHPWRAAEIRRKLELVPTAMAVLHLDLSSEKGSMATLAMEDRRVDRIGESELPFDADGIYEHLPQSLDKLLASIDLEPYENESSELFDTTDHTTALASLYALERIVAFQAGVGREDPRRLFGPALQCLHRDGAHPIARECLVRLGQSLLATERPEDQKATMDAYERWSELVPISPIPPYYLALARQRSGEHEPARGAFEESLRRDPHYGPALQEYAVWLGERGFVEQGVAVLKQAFGRTHIDGALMDQAGCLLANAGRIQEAEPLFRASIMAGGPHTAYANLARGLMARGEEEKALAALNEALASDPEKAHIELLGEIARGSGLAAAQARAMLRGGIAEGSEDELLVKELAAITLELDGAEPAMAQARRLLKISRSAEHRRFAYYVLLKGKIPDLDARWDKAVDDAVDGDAASAESFFREVLKVEPDFGHAQFLLAASLERLDRIRESLFHVEAAAISEESDNAAVLDLLARARAEAGNLAGAAQAHHRAASIAAQDPRILRNAAISLLRAGYYYEGTGLAGASLALQPDQPELNELLRHAIARKEAEGKGVLGRLKQFVRRIRRPT